MTEESTSIPTQPWVDSNNTWPWPQPNTPNPFTGYTCSSCGSWVQHGTFHQCGGWSPGVLTTDNTFGLADFSMYADFVKLLRRDTLRIMKERFLSRLQEIEDATPEDSGFVGFGLDLIEEEFDNIADGVGDESRV